MSVLPHDHVPGMVTTREEEAKRALAGTKISTRLAWAMTIVFLVGILLVPVLQFLTERENNTKPRSLGFFSLFPVVSQVAQVRSLSEAENLLPRVEDIRNFELALEENSPLSQRFLPPIQYALTKFGGAGNEQAQVGRDGWLFYRPDVEYLTGPGFLEPSLLTMRERSGDGASAAVQPDPLAAILDFRDQLTQRNIELVVVPVPVKPMVEPHRLSGRYNASSSGLQNPSYSQFLRELKTRGVQVFDAAPAMQAQKLQGKEPAFLKTDTHWSPEAMQRVAKSLASFVLEKTVLKPGKAKYSAQPKQANGEGDISMMLGLPKDHEIFPAQQVTIEQVFDSGNEKWRSDRGARVLLLGDSFSNIYTLGGMGWGEAAGLGAQLSRFLKQPVDAVVVNAGGSHTSRQRLGGEMKREPNRLRNKQVLIWQFSMRDLAAGDWKLLRLPR